jgi:hypothetical protein
MLIDPNSALQAAGTSTPWAAKSAVDADHATPQVIRTVTQLFRDKTSRSVDRTMRHFAREPMFYTDATLGWQYPTWGSLKSAFAEFMPAWPETARSYPTRIIGDERSAIVLFTNTPELFGHELRVVAAVDFRHGKVVRQVDYWDGRHFGIDATNDLRVSEPEFPQTYGENLVGNPSSLILRATVDHLAEALNRGDATGLFAPDAVFEDLALRTRLAGSIAINAYIARAYQTLPYGREVTIRHTVGNHLGGGYEWTSRQAGVHQGIVAFELDRDRRITRLIITWDGSRLNDASMTGLLRTTLER